MPAGRAVSVLAAELRGLMSHLLAQAVGVDDDPMVGAHADPVHPVPGFHLEYQLVALPFEEFHVCRDGQAGRRGRFMGEIHVRAEALVRGPVQMRPDGLGEFERMSKAWLERAFQVRSFFGGRH